MVKYNHKKQFVFKNKNGKHLFPVNHIFANSTRRNREKKYLDLSMKIGNKEEWIVGFTHVKSMRICGKTVYVYLDLHSE